MRPKTKILLIIFGYKNKQMHPTYLLKESYKDQMELLLIKMKTIHIISTLKMSLVICLIKQIIMEKTFL